MHPDIHAWRDDWDLVLAISGQAFDQSTAVDNRSTAKNVNLDHVRFLCSADLPQASRTPAFEQIALFRYRYGLSCLKQACGCRKRLEPFHLQSPPCRLDSCHLPDNLVSASSKDEEAGCFAGLQFPKSSRRDVLLLPCRQVQM